MAITYSAPTSSDITSVDYDLALKLFAGEIIAEFESASKFLGMTRTREMPAGADSIQFPVLGTAGTKYHAAGENILTTAGYLQQIEGGERIIYADRECLSSVFIPKFEERITHFGFRAEYASKMGHALAKNSDQMLIRVIDNAAQAATVLATGGVGGQGKTTATAIGDPSDTEILTWLLDTQTAMDEDDVPMEGRFAVLSPALMQVLFASGAVNAYLDKDYVGVDGNGNFVDGAVNRIAGFQIVKSNHMSVGNYTDTGSQLLTGKKNDYVGDKSALRAVAFQREAVGTAISANISLESEYKMEYRGDVVVSGYQMGHGILRPECAASLYARLV